MEGQVSAKSKLLALGALAPERPTPLWLPPWQAQSPGNPPYSRVT